MKISVLLPTLGTRKNELARLLNSLSVQNYINFEVIIVSQDNHDIVENMINNYNNIEVVQVKASKKGLSYSRNQGLYKCTGDIVILSDDDCWYHKDSLKIIVDQFTINKDIDILLTKIFDYDNNQPYKSYSNTNKKIRHKKDLMSKSSIEIAFLKKSCNALFDEMFGLGSKYVCGEEVDFLLKNFSKKKKFLFIPETTVFHPKKANSIDPGRVVAKGALYAKNFNILVSILVVLRDLIIKKQNNFKLFFMGYKDYKLTNNLK